MGPFYVIEITPRSVTIAVLTKMARNTLKRAKRISAIHPFPAGSVRAGQAQCCHLGPLFADAATEPDNQLLAVVLAKDGRAAASSSSRSCS